MVVGTLKIELRLYDNRSLKGKRKIVRSMVDKVKHKFNVAVAEVGSNVKNIQPGEHVTFDSTVYCGSCLYCLRGEINLCDQRRVLGVSCD